MQAAVKPKSDLKFSKKEIKHMFADTIIKTDFNSVECTDYGKTYNKKYNIAESNTEMQVSEVLTHYIKHSKDKYKIIYSVFNDSNKLIGKDVNTMDNSSVFNDSIRLNKQGLRNTKYLKLKTEIINEKDKSVVYKQQNRIKPSAKDMKSVFKPVTKIEHPDTDKIKSEAELKSDTKEMNQENIFSLIMMIFFCCFAIFIAILKN